MEKINFIKNSCIGCNKLLTVATYNILYSDKLNVVYKRHVLIWKIIRKKKIYSSEFDEILRNGTATDLILKNTAFT